MKRVLSLGFVLFLISLVSLPSAAGADDNWSMFRNDLRNTGIIDSEVPPAGNVIWHADIGTVVHIPVVVNGKVYVGAWENYFYSFDADNGEFRWRTSIPDKARAVHTSAPTYRNGRIYFGTAGYKENTQFYVLDAEDGSVVWRRKMPNNVNSSPAVVDGKVFFGCRAGKVYALDAGNGNEIWTFDTGDIYTSSPAVYQGTVYIGSWDEHLYALDAETGKLKWSYDTGGEIDSSPVIVDNTLFIGSGTAPGGFWGLHALNPKTGELKWKKELDYPIRSTPVITDERIYLGGGSGSVKGGDEGKIYALSRDDREIIWTHFSKGSMNKGAYIGDLSPIITDNTLLYAADVKALAFEPVTGEVVWERSIGMGTPVAVNNMAFASTGSGLYAIDTRPPTIESPSTDAKVEEKVVIRGTALGDQVDAVELNWGEGWKRVSVELDSVTSWSNDPPPYPFHWVERYVNQWSYSWNTRQVANGTHTIRARVLYENGARSEETTITLKVDNSPLTKTQIAVIVAVVVVGIVALIKFR